MAMERKLKSYGSPDGKALLLTATIVAGVALLWWWGKKIAEPADAIEALHREATANQPTPISVVLEERQR